eukprot:scaffold68080_cov51-Attheya_sp.AAC.1
MCAPDSNVHMLPKKQHVGGNSRIPWGITLVALHLGAIATNLINPLSVSATGTLTVHSWFLGWFIGYKKHGLSCRWVRFDAALLIAASFQLCVGAFAFSRFYYGPLLGHSQDLFQGLSAVYISEEKWLPKAFVEWWLESSGSRFTGLAWYICEAADIATHQAPFVYMCHILSRENGEGWSAVTRSMAKGVWPLSILAGPLHRLIWDYCTCAPIYGQKQEFSFQKEYFGEHGEWSSPNFEAKSDIWIEGVQEHAKVEICQPVGKRFSSSRYWRCVPGTSGV